MGGGLQIQLGAAPHVLAPLCAAAQAMHVARPGEEPGDLLAVEEDTRLLLGGGRVRGGFVCARPRPGDCCALGWG
jgi:hypothetical protein